MKVKAAIAALFFSLFAMQSAVAAEPSYSSGDCIIHPVAV